MKGNALHKRMTQSRKTFARPIRPQLQQITAHHRYLTCLAFRKRAARPSIKGDSSGKRVATSLERARQSALSVYRQCRDAGAIYIRRAIGP